VLRADDLALAQYGVLVRLRVQLTYGLRLHQDRTDLYASTDGNLATTTDTLVPVSCHGVAPQRGGGELT
jgi:hypothetical protein